MNQREIQNRASQQQMTPEELQKTQVLNLQDVEEAARYEKRTSKKPAIIIAVVGALAIFLGTAFPVIQSLKAKEEPKQKTHHKVEKKKLLTNESTLNCIFTAVNNPDGTDTILNMNLTFDSEKLTKVSKTFTINPTAGNPLGVNTVQAYTAGYQPFLAYPIAGYQMTVTPANSGLIVTSEVNYATYDPTKLPDLHKSNIATNVEYPAATDKTAIYNDLLMKGFTCQ